MKFVGELSLTAIVEKGAKKTLWRVNEPFSFATMFGGGHWQ